MIKILICDDEVFARDAMKTIVSRKGFNVFTAATGEECINMLKKESPEVIFLDVMLSDLDGDHLFKYLKDIKKDVDIYFITASGTVFTEENARELGAKGYLSKPVDMKELFDILDKIKKDFGE